MQNTGIIFASALNKNSKVGLGAVISKENITSAIIITNKW